MQCLAKVQSRRRFARGAAYHWAALLLSRWGPERWTGSKDEWAEGVEGVVVDCAYSMRCLL